MTYQYSKPIRYFMGFCVPFFSFFAIGSWFLNMHEDAGIGLPLGFSIFFGLGALYGGFVFIASYGWARLDEKSITIKFFWSLHTVPYQDIKKVKTSGFFITLFTENGRYRIERNIHNFHALVRDVNRRVPKIQQDKETFITDPLPRKIKGKISNLFMFLGFTLLFLFMAFGMTIALLESGGWIEIIFAIFGGIFFGGGALLLIHESFWVLPRYIIFAPDRITIKQYIGKDVYDPHDIETVQIVTVFGNKQKTPSYNLRLQFNSDEKQQLEIREAWFSQHTFQIMDLIIHHYNVEPIYKKHEKEIGYKQFASGSINPFPFYFERDSHVTINSLNAIETWLRQCAYIRDHEQFEDSDVWIHPVDFEQGRKGDCEDHALWAWRKLIGLNYTAEFVVGYVQNHFGDDGYHAWVTFEENGRNYLLEATAKTSKMIFPLETQTKKYRPLFSVDKNFKTYQF